MSTALRVEALVPPDHEDMVAEGYINDECILIVRQEQGFESLDVEFLPRTDGKPWKLKYGLLTELLARCRNRLWELRRVPPAEGGRND